MDLSAGMCWALEPLGLASLLSSLGTPCASKQPGTPPVLHPLRQLASGPSEVKALEKKQWTSTLSVNLPERAGLVAGRAGAPRYGTADWRTMTNGHTQSICCWSGLGRGVVEFRAEVALARG